MGKYLDINGTQKLWNKVKDELNDKVDKVNGKQLSTEDFTTLLKQKLEDLDIDNLNDKIDGLKIRLDTILNEDNATAVIDTFNEIEDFLQGITNTETLTGLLQDLKNEITQLCNNTYIIKPEFGNFYGGSDIIIENTFSGGKITIDSDGTTQLYNRDNNDFSLKTNDEIDLNFYKKTKELGNIHVSDSEGFCITNLISNDDNSLILENNRSLVYTGENVNIFNLNAQNISLSDTLFANNGKLDSDDGDEFFIQNQNTKKTLNLKGDGKLTYDNKEVWHEGNFTPSDYLSISGGDITRGNLRILCPNGTNQYRLLEIGDDTGLNLRIHNASIPGYSTDGSRCATLSLYNGTTVIGDLSLTKSKNLIYRYDNINHKVFHEGFMGSGSGLDADLLKGKQPIDLDVNSAKALISTQLTNNDINNIKFSSNGYHRYHALENNTCINKPDNVGAFYLEVFGTGRSNGIHIITDNTTGISYKRQFKDNIWTPWKKILTEDDIASLISRIEILEEQFRDIEIHYIVIGTTYDGSLENVSSNDDYFDDILYAGYCLVYNKEVCYCEDINTNPIEVFSSGYENINAFIESFNNPFELKLIKTYEDDNSSHYVYSNDEVYKIPFKDIRYIL